MYILPFLLQTYISIDNFRIAEEKKNAIPDMPLENNCSLHRPIYPIRSTMCLLSSSADVLISASDRLVVGT